MGDLVSNNRRAWLALPAILLLNASLTFGNVWPTPKIRWENALSVELAVCVLLMFGAWACGRQLHRGALSAVWVLLIIGHYVDVTAPGLFGRELNLYWDSRHFSNVGAMLIRDVPGWIIIASAAVVVLTLAAASALTFVCMGSLGAAIENTRMRRALVAASAIAVVLFSGQQLSGSFPAGPHFSKPSAAAYARQVRYIAAMIGPGRVASALGESPAFDRSVAGLEHADVVLVFVESYGAVTYDNPQFSQALDASRTDLESAISEAGRQVISAFVESPTFGGNSWLAHLSLISGVEVRDEYANASLLAQQRDTLVTTFAGNGYRTVGLMPGIRQDWPEGAFFRFDIIYNHHSMEYTGPKFGWWTIPDQYALAKLDALELDRKSRKPVFAVFPTGTTHAPFGPVAPYQPDWSLALMPEALDEAEVERALAATPNLADLSPSFLNAMEYEYRSLAGYVREHQGDHVVMIVIGDHQPAAAVSGRDASWDVPIHVITSSATVLARLRNRGFQDGLRQRSPALGPMHALVPVFLDAFGPAATDD